MFTAFSIVQIKHNNINPCLYKRKQTDIHINTRLLWYHYRHAGCFAASSFTSFILRPEYSAISSREGFPTAIIFKAISIALFLFSSAYKK